MMILAYCHPVCAACLTACCALQIDPCIVYTTRFPYGAACRMPSPWCVCCNIISGMLSSQAMHAACCMSHVACCALCVARCMLLRCTLLPCIQMRHMRAVAATPRDQTSSAHPGRPSALALPWLEATTATLHARQCMPSGRNTPTLLRAPLLCSAR
jgi:hypothetical protein